MFQISDIGSNHLKKRHMVLMPTNSDDVKLLKRVDLKGSSKSVLCKKNLDVD